MNWNNVDNYLLLVASFLSAISFGIGDASLALIVLAVGMILKAIGSSIDPKYGWLQNLDNVALAMSGVIALLVTLLAPDAMLTIVVMIAGFLLKAIGSAYVKGAGLYVNIDNIVLAVATAISGVLVGFGYTQAAFFLTALAGLFKAILSNATRIPAAAASPATNTVSNSSTVSPTVS